MRWGNADGVMCDGVMGVMCEGVTGVGIMCEGGRDNVRGGWG